MQETVWTDSGQSEQKKVTRKTRSPDLSNKSMLQVRVYALPVSNCRDDAERDDLVTHLAEMCVRSIERSKFLSGTVDLSNYLQKGGS